MKNLALLTDFYELTMMQGYFFNVPDHRVVFDYFIRKNAFGGGYMVFAGLTTLIEKLEQFSFDEEDIDYLRSTGLFEEKFLSYLRNFRFNCDIFSIREGEIIFPNEPIVTVSGPIAEAQLIESFLLNTLNFQTLIATKTARIVQSVGGKSILEFGLRRAHGKDGALSATRAAFIGGCAATSNTLAGKIYNIPVSGTMAHSWIMCFDDELEAFQSYADLYPDNTVLLVDTYDTLKSGLPKAIIVLKKLQQQGHKNFGVRLDSGNLDELSFAARKMLDEAGLPETKIYISSELDESIITEMLNKNCPIDSFGVGTKMVTGYPDSSLSGVYKLSAVLNGKKSFRPVIKISDNIEKRTNPGSKNVMRFFNSAGLMEADMVYLTSEEKLLVKQIENGYEVKISHQNHHNFDYWAAGYQFAEKLLKPVMLQGRPINPVKDLKMIQNYKNERINLIPDNIKRILGPEEYLTGLSTELFNLKKKMISDSDNRND
jgi:nicotinate phosphoribosyltransferase